MSNWTTVTLAEIGQIFDGPHATPTRQDVGPYFLNIASLSGGRLDLSSSDHVSAEEFAAWTRRVTPRASDLLFSYETRLGEAALMPPSVEACLGRRMALIRPKRDRVDPRFLLYLYLAPQFQSTIEQNTIHGATVNRIPLNRMGAWEVSLPSVPEQQAIAEVLGALDDKIAANTAHATTAETTIAVAYTVASREGVADKPLLDELVIEFGEPFGGAQFSEPGVGRPLVRIRDLKTFRSQVWTTETRHNEVVVAAGDVLVGMDAEFRATPWLGEPGLLNQRVLRARHSTFGRALVREMLRRPLAEVECEKSATTVIHLNKADLARKKVDVPNTDALAAFERLAEPLYEARVALAVENRTLAATRDALLPQLMSGKVHVRDAEAAVSAAGA